jgi:hypothetical protein
MTQRLAELTLLHRMDYLSTVSGGGYIGGRLSSWASRQKGDKADGVRAGVLGVEDRLREGRARGQDPARSPPISSLPIKTLLSQSGKSDALCYLDI